MSPPAPDPVRGAKTRGRRRVAYVFSPDNLRALCLLPVHRHREQGPRDMPAHREAMVHCLIREAGLFEYMRVVAPAPATREQLAEFHSERYLAALAAAPRTTEEREAWGLTDDCPMFHGLWEYCAAVAGGEWQRRVCEGVG